MSRKHHRLDGAAANRGGPTGLASFDENDNDNSNFDNDVTLVDPDHPSSMDGVEMKVLRRGASGSGLRRNSRTNSRSGGNAVDDEHLDQVDLTNAGSAATGNGNLHGLAGGDLEDGTFVGVHRRNGGGGYSSGGDGIDGIEFADGIVETGTIANLSSAGPARTSSRAAVWRLRIIAMFFGLSTAFLLVVAIVQSLQTFRFTKQQLHSAADPLDMSLFKDSTVAFVDWTPERLLSVHGGLLSKLASISGSHKPKIHLLFGSIGNLFPNETSVRDFFSTNFHVLSVDALSSSASTDVPQTSVLRSFLSARFKEHSPSAIILPPTIVDLITLEIGIFSDDETLFARRSLEIISLFAQFAQVSKQPTTTVDPTLSSPFNTSVTLFSSTFSGLSSGSPATTSSSTSSIFSSATVLFIAIDSSAVTELDNALTAIPTTYYAADDKTALSTVSYTLALVRQWWDGVHTWSADLARTDDEAAEVFSVFSLRIGKRS